MEKVLWSDEAKINLFRMNGKQFVGRPQNQVHFLKKTKKKKKIKGGKAA